MPRPAPPSLLVEHPALPVPIAAGDELQVDGGPVAAARRTTPRQQVRLAVQLTALTSLLAEFDLWPGRRALASARVGDSGGVLQAVLPGFPVALSRAYRALGGGERAADAMRGAAVEAIARRTGVPLSAFNPEQARPGFFLEVQLEALLGRLPRPLDAATARNLWAERWEMPPCPEEGEAVFWQAPSERMACRLGAALWCTLRKQGRTAWLHAPSGDDEETGPWPPLDATGVVLLAGRLGEVDLAAARRWAERPGCAAAAIGLFPAGWRPPPPRGGFDASRLPLHLALTGAPVQRCREQVERRQGIFDPVGEADRLSLSTAARWLWQPPEDAAPRPSALVARCLKLLPEGVPEGFLEVQTGRSGAALHRLCPTGSVVVEEGRWRLPRAVELEPDPLHRQVAGLFAAGDPQRLRHLALAEGDARDLVAHCREEISELHGREVRELLAPIAGGALGGEVRLLLVEACLAELDLAGARAALHGAAADEAGPWLAWLGILDAPAEFTPELPGPETVTRAPRAAAEVALFAFRRAHRAGVGDARAARQVLVASQRALSGPLQRWFELETVAVEEPARLDDPSWRRLVVAGHPELARRWLHLRGLRLARAGRARAARRMLEGALSRAGSPGRQGLLELDLGYLALDAGESLRAASHLLRSFRLLEAGGFQHRTQAALFNLAVCDLDALEVERARRRMDELNRRAAGGEDPFVTGERVRLALAVGDERDFHHRLARFPVDLAAVDARFAEQLSLLRGIAALLAGDRRGARPLLERGGAEGRTWLGLVDALEGKPATRGGGDHWGLELAAELVRQAGSAHGTGSRRLLRGGRAPALKESFALALTERLLGRQPWIEDGLREAAARVLARHGLDGWARGLAGMTHAAHALVSGLAGLLEAGDPEALDEELAGDMLASLGLSGIEVASRRGGEALWRWGSGAPAGAAAQGRLLVTPLGGDPSSAEAWRLLLGLLELLLPELPPAHTGDEEATGLYGGSEVMRRLREELRAAAPTGIEVLLLGETGVGKEVAARALHRLSGRRGRFVPVNVAAVPSTLLEAELFGSVRGAYTGAERSRAGLADAADGGTLFLDEIGDLDLPLQVKLLRFVEGREVRPVGADRFHRVDVRIVAATHRDLKGLVSDGAFRSDLYYRIATMPVHVPPLRRRAEDIPVLRTRFEAEAVVAKGLQGCRWSARAEAALARYPWPGNVRELRHVVEVAMVRAAGGTVGLTHLNLEPGPQVPPGKWDEAMRDFRTRFLSAALRRNLGNRSATARELGISRQALLYHIRHLGLQGRRR